MCCCVVCFCGVVVVQPARPIWRSRFSLLRRYQHTSDAFRKSVLRCICAAPVVDMDDVPNATCLRGTRKALNVAFVESLPDAVVAGKCSHARVQRLCEVAARRVCESPCANVVREVRRVTARLSPDACAREKRLRTRARRCCGGLRINDMNASLERARTLRQCEHMNLQRPCKMSKSDHEELRSYEVAPGLYCGRGRGAKPECI